jgi:hypothetical protein
MSPHTTAKIDFLRDGKMRSASVVLGELPTTPFEAAKPPSASSPSGLGLDLGPVANPDGTRSPGAEIVGVDPNGIAADKRSVGAIYRKAGALGVTLGGGRGKKA